MRSALSLSSDALKEDSEVDLLFRLARCLDSAEMKKLRFALDSLPGLTPQEMECMNTEPWVGVWGRNVVLWFLFEFPQGFSCGNPSWVRDSRVLSPHAFKGLS